MVFKMRIAVDNGRPADATGIYLYNVKIPGDFVIFDERQEAEMNLSLGIVLDELAAYKPIVHKANSMEAEFRQFHYYNCEFTESDPRNLYVIDGTESDAVRSVANGKNGPRHIVVTGNSLPNILTGKMDAFDTLIRIPGGLSVAALLQTGYAIFESYETWHNALLMAIIQHRPINTFLEIVVEKLTNALALFDNNMTVISSAGTFTGSPKGTIWEKIYDPKFTLNDFFTPQELRGLSQFISTKKEPPYLSRPSIDSNHTYLRSEIMINNKPCGYIGMVDINTPFTDGQISIIRQIIQVLGLYFQNNSIYMRMLENNVNYLESLLDGADITENIVSRYLDRLKWKLNGEFYFLTFACRIDLTVTSMSVLYTKQISGIFPQALVSVYRDSIVMIIRRADYPLRRGREWQQLEKLLKKNDMRCGVSMMFDRFMRLRYYYIQSSFAAAWYETHPNSPLCYYEECQRDHVLQSLAAAADIRSFCHPAILALWESDDEKQQELVRCLHYYLLNGGNLVTTAKALFVHRNTLIYRLEKLSNTLQCDLKKLMPDQISFYLLSCVIARYGLS
jgi:hypothetical protein